jgi:streptogramin lyase
MFPTDAHVAGTQAAGYQIAGNWPYTFSVAALDAAGNIIVGPGAPVLAVASGSSAVAVTPVNGTPNAYTVQTQHYSAAAVALTITPSSGTPGTVSVTTVPEMWVTNGLVRNVTTYALWPGAGPALLPDAVSAGTEPYGIAFDASGNLWVGNRQDSNIGEYAFRTLAPVTLIVGVGQPIQFAFDASGNLWNTDNAFGDNIVIEHSPPISSTASGSIATGSLPFGLAIDAHGNIWVTSFVPSAITEYVAPAFSAGTSIADANNPYGLAFDASGNLWVANNLSGTAVEYAPPFTGAPVQTITTTTIGAPLGIGIDPAGNLWAANGANAIAEYTAPAFALGTTISDTGGPSFVAFTP